MVIPSDDGGGSSGAIIVGGLAVWFGFHERAGSLVAPPHALSAAVATDLYEALHS